MLTLQSCLNLADPESQAQYIESYKSFDKEMVSHFPLKIPNNWIYLSPGSPKYLSKYCGNIELSLIIQITSKGRFEKLKNQLEKNTKIIKSSFENCFLIVDSGDENFSASCNQYYPVPQETIFNFKSDIWIKKENCEVALIDYKPGIFAESEYLTVKEYLPENWRNGYSRGYSFDNNKQTIMYWLIIW